MFGKFLAGLTLPAVCLFASASLAQDGPPAVPVDVDAVATEPLVQTLPVLGRIVTYRAGDIAARIGGLVQDVAVDVGDRVARNAVLARIRPDRMAAERDLRRAEVGEARARLDTARARLKLSEQELIRLEGLRRSAAFNQARLEDQQQAVAIDRGAAAAAEAGLTSARARLTLSRIGLNDATIRAPYAGVISRRHVAAGAYLNPGTAIVTLIDDSALEIEADIPADYIATLGIGRLVDTETGARPGIAAVRAVVPDENPLTRTRIVRFTPDFAPDAGHAVNQSVTLHIPIGEAREVISVHKDAVLRRGGALVFVVVDGKALPRPVELGAAVGARFEVLSGLSPGELVVVRGNERLRPGQAVLAGAMAEPPS